MRKKKKKEEHVNTERWLVSYADYMTLLFALFVTLYAISQVDAKKLGHFVESLKAALNQKINVIDSESESSLYKKKMPVIATISDPEKDSMARLKVYVQGKVTASRYKDKIQVNLDKRGIIVSLTGTVLFDTGSAEIRQDALPVLDGIAAMLKGIPNAIMVEGHADDTPIHNERFISNWELSAARATSIIRFLIGRYNFPPEQLSAAGYGEYKPVEPNDRPENKAANRRADLVIMSRDY